MFEGGEVAIDGSKFKAVNNRDKNYIQRKITTGMAVEVGDVLTNSSQVKIMIGRP